MTDKKGKFFVIDGTDGSGKETQAKLMIERLKLEGHPVETVSLPQYGQKSAGPVEAYLRERKYGKLEGINGAKAASLLFAVDRFDASLRIRQWLEEGKIVIADRYVASNMGHQGGKIPDRQERANFFAWNDDIEYGVFEIPRPDLNVILHVPPEVAERRLLARDGANQDLHQADPEHLRHAADSYCLIAEMFPEMHLIECCPDGRELTREEIHGMIWGQIQPHLG